MKTKIVKEVPTVLTGPQAFRTAAMGREQGKRCVIAGDDGGAAGRRRICIGLAERAESWEKMEWAYLAGDEAAMPDEMYLFDDVREFGLWLSGGGK